MIQGRVRQPASGAWGLTEKRVLPENCTGSQLRDTPFFFYAIGGYFVIRGQLTVGALIAVIAAYKDIIDPWKELLKWYETKEDVRVKYEQVVTQFDPPGTLPETLITGAPATLPRLAGPLVASGVRYEEDGNERVESLTVTVEPGEQVAIVGAGDSGKDDVARLLARLAHPTAGRLTIGPLSLNRSVAVEPGLTDWFFNSSRAMPMSLSPWHDLARTSVLPSPIPPVKISASRPPITAMYAPMYFLIR